jgi:hypothetical protein
VTVGYVIVLDPDHLPPDLEDVTPTGVVLQPWLRYREDAIIALNGALRETGAEYVEPLTHIDRFLNALAGVEDASKTGATRLV